jgi:uncharacterized protein YggT (Ycf19 family)
MFHRRRHDRDVVYEDEPVRRRAAYDDEPAPRDASYYDEDAPGSRVVREPVMRDSYVERRSTVWTTSLRGGIDRVVLAALFVLEALLAARFLLLAFGANQNSDFVDFIMDISGPIVRPFRDVFTLRTWDHGTLDYNILLAMGIWFIAAVLLVMIINALIPDAHGDYRVDHRRRVTHG